MARPSKPWFRESKGTWYATVGGKMTSLGVRGRENSKEAHDAWHRLMANGSPQPPQDIQPKSEPKVEPTVAVVLDSFLADADGRVKRNTLRVYRYFFKVFRGTEYVQLKASELTPTQCEGF